MNLDGKTFFERFVEEWDHNAKTEGTPSWLYYWKLDRMKKAGIEWLADSEWTPVMITFLDFLASRFDYVQLNERQIPKVRNWDRDCIWTIPPSRNSHVTIEAENRPETVFGPKGEVAKLLRDSSLLKVLVTYHADEYAGKGSAKAWRDDYMPRLMREVTEAGLAIGPERDFDFLLVLGDEVTTNPRDWYGFVLSRRRGHWGTDWTSLPRV